MRYLLIIVGILGVLLGGYAITSGPTVPSGEFLAQVGGVFLAVGLATVDIVETIKAKRL
jgi:hypothetical protein